MTLRTTLSPWAALLVCLLVTFAAAALGAAASLDAASFYGQLNRPAWAPPAWVFGPVWSVLYTLMGVAAWLVWRTADAGRRSALAWFGGQLVANALWSWLFFGWRLGAWAAGEVLLLWALIVVTVQAFRRLSGVAALLLLPYLLWVSFAAVLTWSVWQRNPGLL
ncbi:MAG: TspO/MBR family protein [Burkholderiaceae bacterium]